MAKSPIELGYNEELRDLEKLLAKAQRPGDFFAAGSVSAPMPQLEIQGVGTIAFPLLDMQAKQVIEQAQRAPYGRGEETIVDTNVRKVWQVAPEKVRLGGKTWQGTLHTILERTLAGLGCEGMAVQAELYKLLLYDQGGFFVSHRDTEKAEGMFGTLVVVLPSFHSGGDLLIRHGGRDVSLDLSTQEVSDLTYAAFYADCEHEVHPITKGYRLCLIYNLVQEVTGKDNTIKAPDYSAETAAATELLKKWVDDPESPPKLVYLLEHQYSPAGLSFGGLKNADRSMAKVLRAAGEAAGCAVHLAIVNISESGPAEYYSGSGYSRWDRRRHTEEDVDSGDYQVIEISNSSQHLDNWVDVEDQRVEFGEIPLGDNELLPAGALDKEKPDIHRVSEATGNEGATFERAYHRAALVLWSEKRYAEVVLQSGVGAALPYLEKLLKGTAAAGSTAVERPKPSNEASRLARRMVEMWQTSPGRGYLGSEEQALQRVKMLRLLRELGDAKLLADFVRTVVTEHYDGTENKELVNAALVLGPSGCGQVFSGLLKQNMKAFPGSGIDLVKRIVHKSQARAGEEWEGAGKRIAHSAVEELTSSTPLDENAFQWWRRQKAKPIDGPALATLFEVIWHLKLTKLEKTLTEAVVSRVGDYPPETTVIPALTALQQQDNETAGEQLAFPKLWEHAAEFLLSRSEHPPLEPPDWTQKVRLDCKCAECRELEAFTRDPQRREFRLQARQAVRSHVENMIRNHSLDIACDTDLRGRPQTLICTKTRWSYEKACKEYQEDLRHMKALLNLAPSSAKELTIERLKRSVAG